jgi:hypothetical protein
MFGRDLTEQAVVDCSTADYLVPLIVDKCIEAVEALGMGIHNRVISCT